MTSRLALMLLLVMALAWSLPTFASQIPPMEKVNDWYCTKHRVNYFAFSGQRQVSAIYVFSSHHKTYIYGNYDFHYMENNAQASYLLFQNGDYRTDLRVMSKGWLHLSPPTSETIVVQSDQPFKACSETIPRADRWCLNGVPCY